MTVLFKPDMGTMWIRATVVQQTATGYMLRCDWGESNSKPFFVNKEYVKSTGA